MQSSSYASDKGCISNGKFQPGGNNILCQVFLQFKPGVRFGPGPFRVTFDPSQEQAPPNRTQNFPNCVVFGEWLRVGVSSVEISLRTGTPCPSHVLGVEGKFPCLWLRLFLSNHEQISQGTCLSSFPSYLPHTLPQNCYCCCCYYFYATLITWQPSSKTFNGSPLPLFVLIFIIFKVNPRRAKYYHYKV